MHVQQAVGIRTKLFTAGVSAAGVIVLVYLIYGLFIAPVRLEWILLLISGITLLLIYAVYKTYIENVESSNEHIERLTRLHLATIESLTMAIDAKDEMARGHIQRVRLLAEGLARAVGYAEEQMEGLKTAALLHDIGKLAVPEHILNKPGKLSKAEYSKIMNHPVVGADILSNVEFPYEVVPIVKHHHEKFDGTGYPSQLKGEEIPLGARILTVVDCYDALVTDRPHRPSHTRAEALELMRMESGRTFDPAILGAFFRVIDSIEEMLPVADHPVFSPDESGSYATTGSLFDRVVGDKPKSRTEEAMRDIAAAHREVFSLYEISQTLGSALKLSEILPIVAAKLEKIADFTTLVIYLAKGGSLQAAHVIGKHAELLKGLSLDLGEGGAGWVASHRQILIGGSPLADLERPLGREAALYRSTAIFPLLNNDRVIGTLALYSEEDPGYTPDEVRLLETVSSHVATAVYNALVFERTEESALTDNLTGLPNSRYLYSCFDQERSRAERHDYPLVLMMMDLEGFKKVNDTYGHHVGDDLLRRISGSLRAHLRTDDTLVRYAGDEFVAVLHRATSDVVLDLKTRLQSALDDFAHEVRPGRIARVGISIGHATYGQDGLAIEELMEVADQRMYEDKTARRLRASLPPVASTQANSIRL